MATELFAVFGNDLALQLTPVGAGRYEVYLNDRKIWDRKEAPGHPYPNLAIIRDLREVIDQELAAVPAASAD